MPTSHTALRAAIQELAQPERAKLLGRFFKSGPGQYAEGDLFWGLTMPQQRNLAQQFAGLAIEEVEHLIQDPIHECRMTALLIWVIQMKKGHTAHREQLVERYVANRQFINNWDLVDNSCYHILGQHLLKTDRSVLYELAQEDYLWSQRMAMVSTFAFIRNGQFSDTFAIAELLLPHRHDLIHKAVGWMLREVGKRSPDALEEFLHDHVSHMPRTALRYAIERFPPDKRAYYRGL